MPINCKSLVWLGSKKMLEISEMPTIDAAIANLDPEIEYKEMLSRTVYTPSYLSQTASEQAAGVKPVDPISDWRF